MNLLKNPDFEGEFRAWNGIAEIGVAEGWLPFWVAHRPGDEEWKNRRPIFRRASRSVDPRRVYAGESAQMYFTAWATHVAGLMQQVTVPSGQRLRFKAFGHAWSTDEDTPARSTNPGNVRLRIGIGPRGEINPFAASVVWSAEKAVYDRYDDGFVVEATAESPTITVFLFSAVWQPRKHNDVYWDSASLEAVGAVASDSPIAQDVMLVMDSHTRQAGQPVSVHAVSPRSLANAHLSISGPTGAIEPLFRGSRTESGRGHVWRWEFTPAVAGPYTATFSADAINAVSARINITSTSQGESKSPASVRGRPRTQYSRTYLLLPPNAGKEWMQAVLDSGAWTRHRWTVGFSADDAGIGDLDDRTVLIVNPSAWPDPIEPWFALWYPGVKVHAINASSPEVLRVVLQSI